MRDVHVDEKGYLRYSLNYIQVLQRDLETTSKRTELVMSLLLMSIIRAGIFKLHEREAEKLGKAIRDYDQKLKAKQRELLDEDSRIGRDKVARFRDSSRSDLSKERHRHDSSQRTQWVRARRSR